MRVETASSSATWKWKYCNFKSHPSHSFSSLPIVRRRWLCVVSESHFSAASNLRSYQFEFKHPKPKWNPQYPHHIYSSQPTIYSSKNSVRELIHLAIHSEYPTYYNFSFSLHRAMRSFHSRVSVFCAMQQQQNSSSRRRYIQYPIQATEEQNIVQNDDNDIDDGVRRRREKNTEWFILIWSLNHLTFTFFTSRKLTTFEKGDEKKECCFESPPLGRS